MLINDTPPPDLEDNLDWDERPRGWALPWHKFVKFMVSRPVETALFCATGVGIPLLVYGYRESMQIELREIELPLVELPRPFDGYRLVHVSDLHSRYCGRRERRLLELLGSLRADVLLLGGDYQYQPRTPPGPVFEVCRRLAEVHDFPDGTIAVRGNHDRGELHRMLKRQNFMRYLNDEHVYLRRQGERIAVCGLKYYGMTEWKIFKGLRSVMMNLNDDAFKILLAHAPDAFQQAARMGFDFTLAGDTHGGQLRLPGIGPLIRKTSMGREYSWGFNRMEGMPCYTNAGIGVIGLPARLFCRPEVVVFTLRRSESE